VTRDPHGRFVKGNPGGPGRGKKEVEESYLQAFRDTVSPEDWRAIIGKAVADAKNGDATARRFIADYLIGTPKQSIEMTGKNDGAIRLKWEDGTDIPAFASGPAGSLE